ncbi:peptidoglycan recognition protein family protein [Streptomyces sp. NBC_00344]|uniref:peptidoglycan recognition protein family protein n=1 Tax=Streptomyces sp. NBC_00344 TaxID=2975720 RepID=UPI002E21241C
MRPLLSSAVLSVSIAVVSATALALPLAAPAGAGTPAGGVRAAGVPGSTQSLRLAPLSSSDRSPAPAEAGLSKRTVTPFSLVGVVWDDPRAELAGTAQVRTRPVGSRTWTGWQNIEVHNDDHAADPGTPEADAPTVHGSTAPLWVGASDGVQLRVRQATAATSARAAATRLPRGLHLDLVDPGPDPDSLTKTAAGSDAARASSAANAGLAPLGANEIPALSKQATEASLRDDTMTTGPTGTTGTGTTATTGTTDTAGTAGTTGPTDLKVKSFIGARPSIVTRKGWGADETIRESAFRYTDTVKAAFVHHTATGNNYTCAQAPSLLRGIYRYHVKSNGWRDIGYNFAIDKCGTIYEGRAGGVAKPVMGAHTLGFNTDSTGIAVLGTFGTSNPPAAVTRALASLTAWKLGLTGADPNGRTTLISGGGNRFAKGSAVSLHVISGHRDGFATDCPGALLYSKLGSIRTASARAQGR